MYQLFRVRLLASLLPEVWRDDGNRFEVRIDAGGRVVSLHKRAGYSKEPGTFWQRLRL